MAWPMVGPGFGGPGGPAGLAGRMRPQRTSIERRPGWLEFEARERSRQAEMMRPRALAAAPFSLAPATAAALEATGANLGGTRGARAGASRPTLPVPWRSRPLRRAAVAAMAGLTLALAANAAPGTMESLLPSGPQPVSTPYVAVEAPVPIPVEVAATVSDVASAMARLPLRLPGIAFDGPAPSATQSPVSPTPSPAPRGEGEVESRSTGADVTVLPIVVESPAPPTPVPSPTATPTASPSRTPTPSAATVNDAAKVADAGNIDTWLEEAGWPVNLRPQAKRVAYCESSYQPKAVNGNARGLFQVWQDLRPGGWGWFTTFGYDPNLWPDPVVNARVALLVYLYDLQHGYRPWTQWTCKP